MNDLSNKCSFLIGTWPVCNERICPYTDAPLIDCRRADGTRCNAYGDPTCLTEGSAKFATCKKRFELTDFTKYTFNKDKYLPKSYLPGDGADFLFGYHSKINPDDIGAGKCGSQACETKLDYLLEKLKQPICPIESYDSNLTCSSRKPCPYRYQPCGIPNESKTSNGGANDCPFFEPKKTCKQEKPKGCGAPDCKYGGAKPKKGCGAPDCKYAERRESACLETNTKVKRDSSYSQKSVSICEGCEKKENGAGECCNKDVCPFVKSETSKVSCDNPECPFAAKIVPECHDKSCPYAKELTICQDCGGVILEGVEVEPVPEAPPPETAVFESPAVTTTVEVEKIRISTEKDKKIDSRKPSFKKKSVDMKQSKRKKEVLFNYPGTVIGHHDCMYKRKNIPANMGWLWNIKPTIGNPDLWRGYKPGAISKTVHKIIRKHRRALGILDPSDIIKKRRSKTSNRALSDKNKRVISVKKKEGNYLVTLTPIKDPLYRTDHESPFIDCTPVQFKINKPPKPEISEENPCECDLTDEEKDTDSDLSELDVNFSPPAALPVKPYTKKKIKVTKDTQYTLNDFPKGTKHSHSGKGEKSKKKGKKKVTF